MSSTQSNTFGGSLPEIYQTHLVPLIFESYADDIVQRLTSRSPTRVLEVAAGTGVVTRRLVDALPDATIVASDMSLPMLERAQLMGTSRPIEWRQADAMQLPFEDGAFDAVVCQFGAMFFPDKAKAFAEAHRVLRPGGLYLLNVWDRLADNEFADVITAALAALFPDAPPQFLPRTPYGYHDQQILRSDLARGGFSAPALATVTHTSRALSAQIPALAYCQGTPLRNEIEAQGGSRLTEATDFAAAAIWGRFGSSPVEGKIQAHVVTAER